MELNDETQVDWLRKRSTSGIITAELGLHFYDPRWFDSSLGRFTSEDKLVPNSGIGQAFDRFAYELNNGSGNHYGLA